MDLLNRMIDSRRDKDMDEMKKYMKTVIENMMMPLLPKPCLEMSPSPSSHEASLVYRPPSSEIIGPQDLVPDSKVPPEQIWESTAKVTDKQISLLREVSVAQLDQS